MKTFICVLTAVAIASIAANVAFAADLDEGYEERGAYVERPPPAPVRYVAPHYYAPDWYNEDSLVAHYPYRYRRPYPYYRHYPSYYPYRWGPRFHGWHHAYWGPRHRW